MLLHQFLVDFYVPLTGISPRTQKLYEFTLASWGEFLGTPPTVDDLDMLPVAQFITHRTTTRSPATAAKDRAQIVALWNAAAKQKLCDSFPMVRRVKVPENLPEAWTIEEFRILCASCLRENGMIGDIPAKYFWRSLLLCAYDTGERISAIMSLPFEDVSRTGVIFRAAHRKGNRRDIYRQIGQETIDAINAIRSEREKVWPWPYHPNYLWRKFSRVLTNANLPSGRRHKFHKIRRTTASFFQANGGSAQSLLDHSNPATTRRYLDPRIVGGFSAPDVLPRVGTVCAAESAAVPPVE